MTPAVEVSLHTSVYEHVAGYVSDRVCGRLWTEIDEHTEENLDMIQNELDDCLIKDALKVRRKE